MTDKRIRLSLPLDAFCFIRGRFDSNKVQVAINHFQFGDDAMLLIDHAFFVTLELILGNETTGPTFRLILIPSLRPPCARLAAYHEASHTEYPIPLHSARWLSATFHGVSR